MVSESGHRTRTAGTRFGKTSGKPVPVQGLNDGWDPDEQLHITLLPPDFPSSMTCPLSPFLSLYTNPKPTGPDDFKCRPLTDDHMKSTNPQPIPLLVMSQSIIFFPVPASCCAHAMQPRTDSSLL